jgi:hypothetical protein
MSTHWNLVDLTLSTWLSQRGVDTELSVHPDMFSFRICYFLVELAKGVYMRWMIPKKSLALPWVLAISQSVKLRLWKSQAEHKALGFTSKKFPLYPLIFFSYLTHCHKVVIAHHLCQDQEVLFDSLAHKNSLPTPIGFFYAKMTWR